MEENFENRSEKAIDLRVIFRVLKRNIVFIIVVTLLLGAGTYAVSKFIITKQYSASAMLIVNNKANDKATYNTAELNAAHDLAEVYAIIIKSDTVLQKVIDDLSLNMTYLQLNKCVSVSSVNKTQVFRITVTYPDPVFAEKVMKKIVQVAPPIISDKVDAGSVKVISEAGIDNNGSPVSPDCGKNAVVGAFAGLALALVIILIKELVNNTFKTEEDVINTLHVPLIGIIPEVDRKGIHK